MRASTLRRMLPAVAGCLLATALPAATPAGASTSMTDERAVQETHTSFTVRVADQGSGWKYRAYASTRKSDVYTGSLASAPYHSAWRSTPRLTVRNLPYSTKAYWWRIRAVKGSGHRTGAIRSVGLRPDAATHLKVVRGAAGGLALHWRSSSFGFQVEQALDSSFSTGRRLYTGRGLGRLFTPYGLAPGTSYAFRVRAVNHGTRSAWTPAVQATATAHQQRLRVGQFNIHEGAIPNSSEPSSWKVRRDAVAALVRQSRAQIVSVPEGATWVDSKCGMRQIDDMVNRIGSPWALAHTEPVPCQEKGWHRTGVYIIYNSSLWKPVGDGGHFDIGGSYLKKPRWSAWQVFENRSTGARFLFTASHLINNNTLRLDKERAEEAQNLLDHVKALGLGYPVVYNGDFNSHEKHRYDGPGIVMRKADIADTWYVAQDRVRWHYNSANGYQRRPPHQALSIDHVYAPAGVALRRWKLIMNIKDGKFVGTIPSDHNMLVADISFPY